MKARIFQHKIGIMGRNLLTYALAILLAGVLIAAVILFSSVQRIREMELESWEHSISRVAKELDTQQELLRSIHSRMMISYAFQPAARSNSIMGDIQLLENITAYTTQSPISDSFFILYGGENHIYLSEGYKSLYKTYLCARIACSETEAMTIYDQIQSSDSFSILPVSAETLLFVCPVRFPSSRTMAYTCFFVSQNSLKDYLEKIAGDSLTQYAVYYRGAQILSENISKQVDCPTLFPGATERQKASNIYTISACSENGDFAVLSQGTLRNIYSFQNANRLFITLIIVLILLVILLLATCFAYISSRPIRDLASRVNHSPVLGDELQTLETVFLRLEKENRVSLKNLRDQIVISLLDGNYSPELLSRWDVLQISLDFPCSAVFLIRADGYPIGDTNFIRQIESISDQDIRLYAVWRKDMVEVIANFQDTHQYDTISDCIQSLSNQVPFQIYAGSTVDSPYKINLSRLEALSLVEQKRPTEKVSSALMAEDKDRLITEISTFVLEYSQEDQLDSVLEKLREYVQLYAPSLLIQKHICYDLLNQLMRCARENGLELDSRKVSELLLIQNFDVFLRDLKRLILDAFPMDKKKNQTELSKQVIAYIQQNACDCNLSVDRVLASFQISAVYLNNMVKKETSLCFKEYVTYLRMKKAMELLISQPEMTVNEISCICGYNKPSNFIKKFKETTAQTPTQYRRKQ